MYTGDDLVAAGVLMEAKSVGPTDNDKMRDPPGKDGSREKGSRLWLTSSAGLIRVFEGGEVGLSYGRNTTLGLATLYRQGSNLDLRFDLAGQVAYFRRADTPG